jgi:Kef-type K+ transport system membrane component KefB
MPDILLLLSQIAGILVTARLVGRAVALIGQPRVVGEMLVGSCWSPVLARIYPVRLLAAAGQHGEPESTPG